MAFKDLAALTDGLRITLPIRGKHYTIEDVDAETGLWAQRLWDLGSKASTGREVDGADLDDNEEEQLYQRLLGDTFDEMKADGIRWGEIRHVGLTVLIWITNGEPAAEAYWEKALREDEPDEGEARTPGRQGSRPVSGGAATTTRRQGSGSGTRAGTKPRSKKGRAGGKSSRSGR